MARTKTIPRLPYEARSLQQRLNDWRSQRRPGMPIPEELWTEAVSLADTHGVGRIARGLPLDYGALKKRVALAPPVAPCSPAFIEIPSIESSSVSNAVVEIARPDGTRMKMRLSEGEQLDMVGLVGLFCGCAR